MKVTFILLYLFLVAAFAFERSYGKLNVPKLEYVIDGDTFVVTLASGFPAIIRDSIHVRIYGINTPEMSSKDSASHANALKARIYLEAQLRQAKRIALTHVMRDKYFRLLAVVKADTMDVGAAMIRAGLAVPYFGGTK